MREARAGAAADWAEAGVAAEQVGRLARWDDLHALFTVEAVGDAWRWRMVQNGSEWFKCVCWKCHQTCLNMLTSIAGRMCRLIFIPANRVGKG